MLSDRQVATGSCPTGADTRSRRGHGGAGDGCAASRRRSSRPSTTSDPALGRSSPAISRRSDDFPLPEGPTIAVTAPRGNAHDTSCRAHGPRRVGVRYTRLDRISRGRRRHSATRSTSPSRTARDARLARRPPASAAAANPTTASPSSSQGITADRIRRDRGERIDVRGHDRCADESGTRAHHERGDQHDRQFEDQRRVASSPAPSPCVRRARSPRPANADEPARRRSPRSAPRGSRPSRAG